MAGSLESKSTQKAEWQQLAGSGRLFAVIDACNEPSVLKKANEVGPQRAVSLYRGSAEQRYAHVGPFLFQIDEPSFGWINESLWKSEWGIFAYADSQLEALRTHFRHFLKVKSTDQKEYLFRFYDPRILPPFLEACNESELDEFFGPVRGFGAKDGDAVRLLRRREQT